MDNDEQPDRRPVGKEGAGAHQEGPNSVQAGQTQRRENSAPEKAPKTGMPDVSPNDGTTSRESESVVDQEPGPFDDDGLPDNARRRVPS